MAAPLTQSKKVVAWWRGGVARQTDTKPAKKTDTARVAASTAISKRRESRTSAKAPAGKVKRNQVGVTAGGRIERNRKRTGVKARDQPT